MIVAITGHRPNKIGGYDFYNPTRIQLREWMKSKLLELNPQYTISGMALGVDQDFAYASLEVSIPFLAAIPFEGQESRWPSESQRFYRELLDRAFRTVVVSPGSYAGWKMQRRNEWMADHCQVLLAVWDGTSGGTSNCVGYAQKIGRQIKRINPSTWQTYE